MPVVWLILIVLVLAVLGFIAGRMRVTTAGGARPHSLPNYYGWNVAMKVMVPAFLALVIWRLVQPSVVDGKVSGRIDEAAMPEGSTLGLVMSDVRRVADGLDLAVSRGLMTADSASSIRTESTDVR
ncbi:phosphate ABC transporter permease subunit PstC, partial [Salipiger sp. HF18]|uniref:phosphate ABC transporter permease family protein n=1 Tax=Salipiger sp. HF18 TaxID=2721557 RepID=UPI00158A275C